MSATPHVRHLSRSNRTAKGERARQRIREIDARAAGRVLPSNAGGSLQSVHSAGELVGLLATARVAELEEREDGRRCFVLQHEAAPDARLAELWVLPALPIGRFDLGLLGTAGLGPTIQGAKTHDALPLSAAAPLLSHVLGALRVRDQPAVEAAAALPGLSAHVATLTAADLDSAFGSQAADAAMMMALASAASEAFPNVRQCTVARPVWVALAEAFAASAAAEEAALYRSAGGVDYGIAYLADTSPEALRQSGGAMALLSWPDEPEVGGGS